MADIYGTGLWLPQGFMLDDPIEVGRSEGGEGEMAMSFTGRWSCPKCGEAHEVTFAAEESVSTDQLEDMFGAHVEKAWKEHLEKHELIGTRLTPVKIGQTPDVRKHVAEALRDYWATKKRMADSANNQIHWTF